MRGVQYTVPVIFSRSDGDVELAWLSATSEQVQLRRFRAHLGHVVEVTEPGDRLVRVGPGLVRRGCLRVEGSLEATIQRAVDASADEAGEGAAQAPAQPAAEASAGAALPASGAQAPWWRPAWLNRLPGALAPFRHGAEQRRLHSSP